MDTCLRPGAEMLFRHKWRNVDTVSLLLPCIGECRCFVCWKEFLSSADQGVGWSFLVLQKRFQFDFKGELKTNEKNSEFFVGSFPHFVNFISALTEICKNCSSVIVLWRHRIFLLVWGIFCFFFLKIAFILLASGFCYIVWWALLIRGNCTSFVWAYAIVGCSQLVIVFYHGCITWKSGKFHMRKDAYKNALFAF